MCPLAKTNRKKLLLFFADSPRFESEPRCPVSKVLRLKVSGFGGPVAEWSKALQLREKINENLRIPGLPPGLGNLFKAKAKGIR